MTLTPSKVWPLVTRSSSSGDDDDEDESAAVIRAVQLQCVDHLVEY